MSYHDATMRDNFTNAFVLYSGGALDSCNCDVGFTLCDNCNGTSLQCSCLNSDSTDRKVTLMDMSKLRTSVQARTWNEPATVQRNVPSRRLTCGSTDEFLGIGLGEQGRVVLYCDGVYGEWNQCVKNGAKTQCPSVLR